MLQAEPSSTNSKKTNGMKHFFILLTILALLPSPSLASDTVGWG